MGTKRNPGPYDCYHAAEPDEPMFVLLGRDKHASILVWLWAALREMEGGNPEKVDNARACAISMVHWYRMKHPAKDASAMTAIEAAELTEELARESLRPIGFEQRILGELRAIRQNTENIMAAIDDLKTAINDLATEAVADLESVLAKLTALPADDTAALQALTQQATDATAKLKSSMATLTGQPVATPAGTATPAATGA